MEILVLVIIFFVVLALLIPIAIGIGIGLTRGRRTLPPPIRRAGPWPTTTRSSGSDTWYDHSEYDRDSRADGGFFDSGCSDSGGGGGDSGGGGGD